MYTCRNNPESTTYKCETKNYQLAAYLADIEMDDFETRATRQRMNALMGEIHGDSDED